jgi:hypothetical protein
VRGPPRRSRGGGAEGITPLHGTPLFSSRSGLTMSGIRTVQQKGPTSHRIGRIIRDKFHANSAKMSNKHCDKLKRLPWNSQYIHNEQTKADNRRHPSPPRRNSGFFHMTPPSKSYAKHIALAALSIYSVLALPIVLLFAGNWIFRYHFFNLMAHYRSKIKQPYTLHAGDSITAGAGHWALLLDNSPFSSITLAENGYTVRQITSQVSAAKQYRPKVISIMAGTNDIFHPRYRLQDVLLDYKEMLKTAEDAAERCIVTLPTKTKGTRSGGEMAQREIQPC